MCSRIGQFLITVCTFDERHVPLRCGRSAISPWRWLSSWLSTLSPFVQSEHSYVKTHVAVHGPVIHIEDVARFYKVYDAAGGHPTAEQLQRDYIDPGSDGLHELGKLRNISGTTIAEELSKRPEISDAKRCMAVLPRARQRLEVAFDKLDQLYPEAKFPPMTIAVGRGKPVGVGSPVTGVQIGLEALCAVKYFDPNLEDRFVHVIAHEYVHVQQVRALVDDQHPTVLEASPD